MRKYFYLFLLLLFFCTNLKGEDLKDLSQIDVSLSAECEPLTTVAGCVNVISGSFFQVDNDFIVNTIEPISLVRYYDSNSFYEGFLGCRFGSQFPLAASHPQLHYKHYYALIPEREGFSIPYKGEESSKSKHIKMMCKVDPKLMEKGYTNLSSSGLSGQANCVNWKAAFVDGNHFTGWKVKLGDGTIREYGKELRIDTISDLNCFTKQIHFLTEETKPNGCHVCFSYIPMKGALYPSSITTYNRQKTAILNQISFQYSENGFIVWNVRNGHSQRLASYVQTTDMWELKQGKDRSRHPHKVLKTVIPEDSVATTYHLGTEPHNYLRICKIEKSNQVLLKVKYDSEHRVKSLLEPIGPNKSFITTYRFEYEKDCTKVFDAINQLTVYHFDSNKRLSAIDYFDENGQSIRKEKFAWSKTEGQKGWLKGKYLCIGDQIFHAKTFEYDERGNIIKETVKGNLTSKAVSSLSHDEMLLEPEKTETYSISYTYYENNLLATKETPEGLKTSYEYFEDTNLISKQLQSYQGRIQERLFNQYDTNGFLIGVIEDNGSGSDLMDLRDVSVRKHKAISLVSDVRLPSFGKPSQTLEYYLCDGKMTPLKRIEFQYDDHGYETNQKVYDASNTFCYELVKQYDHRHLLKAKNNALSYVTTYEYDQYNNLTKESLVGFNKTIEYKYDFACHLIEKKEVYSNQTFTTHYTYNAIGQMIAETDRYGNTTHYAYDRLGRQKQCIKPAIEGLLGNATQPTISKTYNIFNQIESETDENNHTTKASYTSYGKPIVIHYPDGSKERFHYDLGGHLKQKWDADGGSVQYAYNPKGRITCEKTLDKNGHLLKQETYAYQGPLLVSKTDAMGLTTFYGYDGAGRKQSEKVGEKLITYTYDSLGRIHKLSHYLNDHSGQVEIYGYDFLDQMISKEYRDFQGHLFAKETYAYDRFGNLIKECVWKNDQEIATTTFQYNTDGTLLLETDALGNRTAYTYSHSHTNIFGQKVRCTCTHDALGRCVVVEEDALHRIIRRNIHEGPTVISSTHYIYNGKGQKIRQIEKTNDGKNYTIAWTYNKRGLVESETELASNKQTTFQYNKKGQLIHKHKPDGIIISYAYDVLGRAIAVASSDKSIAYQYEYNLHDLPIKIVDLVHGLTQYRSYDLLGRLKKDEMSPGVVLEYTYDALDRVTSLKLPDESCIQYSYDPFHLRKISRIQANKDIRYAYDCHSYDLNGNLLKRSCPAGSIESEFDLLGRMIKIKAPHFESCLTQFDPVGNLLTMQRMDPQGETLESFDYDRFDQIVKEGISHEYQFDSLGNCTRKDGQALNVNALNQITNDGACEYKYNPNGSLIFASNPRTEYTYDAFDRLVSITQDGSSTRFVFDAFGRCLFITNEKETKQLLYIDLQEIGSIKEGKIDALRIVHPETCDTFAIEIDKQVFFPVQDHRYNICALLKEDGELAQWYRYSAFGEEQVYSEQECENPWRFASKRNVNGLLIFAHRFYNPQLMRWQTTDPSGFEDGPNLYSYVHNNPFTHIDLFGLHDIDLRGLGFWQRWEAMDTEYFVSQAKYSTRELAGHGWTGTAKGLFEGYMDPSECASDGFIDWQNHDDVRDTLQAVGQNVGRVGGITINMAQTAVNVVASTVICIGRIAAKKIFSYTIDKVSGFASKKFKSSHLETVNKEKKFHKISYKSQEVLTPNPLEGISYNPKVRRDMRLHALTAKPDFHAFPLLVDNYAKYGNIESIIGRDGIKRTKIKLPGIYQGRNGYFEWILESDKSVNHRFFDSDLIK